MKKITAFILVLLMVFSLCACGSGRSASYEETAVESRSADADYGTTYNMSLSAEASAGTSGLGNGMSGSSGSGTETDSDTDLLPEKIIYSADVTVETTEFEKTLTSLTALVESCGGFIESSSVSDDSYWSKANGYTGGRYASYTIRIPGTCFNDIMGSLGSLGNIPYSYTYTQNVTSQYYDIQARLEAYEAQEQRLIELMEQAESVDDIIAIEDRLTEVRYTIDSLQSSLNNYDRQVSYSTINLSVEEVEEYTPASSVSFGEKIGKAFRSGLEAVAEFFRNLVLLIAEALPAVVLLAAAALIVILSVRRSNAKRRAKRANSQRSSASRETIPAEPSVNADGTEKKASAEKAE